MTNKKSDGSAISDFKYIYDLAGRQTSKTDSYGTTTYEYDKAGRVTKVTAPGKTTVYAYDNAGNRLSLNETYTSVQPSGYIDKASGIDVQYILKKSEYAYSSTNTLLRLVERMFDENNKEIARKTIKYVYDDNGNQLRESTSYILSSNTTIHQSIKGSAYGDGISSGVDKLIEKTSYTYDGFNRLKKAENVKGGVRSIAEYTYDGDGLRVSKTVKKSDSGYIAEVTNYLYDRENVILETSASGSVKTRYIKGINYIASMDVSYKLSYFLFNGHGDVMQTVDEAGEIQNQYDYDIFGNPTLTVETYSNSIRYAGYMYDSETGLYYLNARYYDSTIARFLSEDSYAGDSNDPLSLNFYTYCLNDPIMYTDPTGHTAKDDDKYSTVAQGLIIVESQKWQDAKAEYDKAVKNNDKDAKAKAQSKMDAAHEAAEFIRFIDRATDTYKIDGANDRKLIDANGKILLTETNSNGQTVVIRIQENGQEKGATGYGQIVVPELYVYSKATEQINKNDLIIKAQNQGVGALKSSATISGSIPDFTMNDFKLGVNNCVLTGTTRIVQYLKQNNIPYGNLDPLPSDKQVYNAVTSIAEKKYKYSDSEGVPNPLDNAKLLSDALKSYGIREYEVKNKFLKQANFSEMETNIDNDRPFLLNMPAKEFFGLHVSDNETYENHTVTAIGYQEYSTNASGEIKLVEVYDGWSSTPRYIDYAGLLSDSKVLNTQYSGYSITVLD